MQEGILCAQERWVVCMKAILDIENKQADGGCILVSNQNNEVNVEVCKCKIALFSNVKM